MLGVMAVTGGQGTRTGLMPRHTVLRSRDLDEACAFAARAWRPYQRVRALGPRPFDGFVQHVRGSLLGLTYFETTSHLDVDVGELEDFYAVNLCLAGARARHTAGRALVDCDARTAVIHSPGEAVRYSREGHGAFLMVRVDARALVWELEAQSDRPARAGLVVAPALSLDGPGARLPGLLRLLARRLDRLPPGTAPPAACVELERVILSELLGAAAPWEGMAGPDPGAGALRRAEAYVRAHLQHPLSAGQIARAAGVSARTLFRAFERVHGCSPMGYVRRARLERVRRTLLAPGPAGSVTDAALTWGFTHLGRFSGYYRRAFGEAPSRTLARRSG